MQTRIETTDTRAGVRRVIYSSPGAIQAEFEADNQRGQKLRNALDSFVGTNGRRSAHWMPRGFTSEKAIKACSLGIKDNVDLIKAEKARAEKLQVQVAYPTWQSDVAGAFPDVPTFLAGDPMSMRRLVNQVQDTRPVRIFVGMASSCSFSAEELAKRGALVSALALQLAKTRAVQIYSVNASRISAENLDWVVMCKLHVPAASTDLAYWICHQASVRGLLYSIETVECGYLTWPAKLCGFASYLTPEAISVQAELFGATDADIVIPFPYGYTHEVEMFSNPELWMRNALSRVNALAD